MFFFSFQITQRNYANVFNCCCDIIILTLKAISIHSRTEYSENRTRRRVSALSQNETCDILFSCDSNTEKFLQSGSMLLSFSRWNARASHKSSRTSREAHATVSKSMRGRRRDPHPLFRHRYHHRRCRYHPRRLLSLFGNLSSDSVQLSSVAPLGRCGSCIVASSRKLSRARAIPKLSLFFSKFAVWLSLLFLLFSLSFSNLLLLSKYMRYMY